MKPTAQILREWYFSARLAQAFLLVYLFCTNSVGQGLGLDVHMENRRPRLAWNSTAGGVYHVLSRESLGSGAWQRIATIVSEGASCNWLDSDVATATRFYRLTLEETAVKAQLSIVHPDSVPPALLQTVTNGTYSTVKLLVQTL